MAFSHPFFLIVCISCVHGSSLLLTVRQLIVQPISFRACMVHVFLGRVFCAFSLSFQFLLAATSQPSAAQSDFPTFFSPLFWRARRGESWRRVRPMADGLDCRGGGKRWCWAGYGQTFGEKGEGGCHVLVLKRGDENVQNGEENEVKNDEKYKQTWRKMKQKTKRNK